MPKFCGRRRAQAIRECRPFLCTSLHSLESGTSDAEILFPYVVAAGGVKHATTVAAVRFGASVTCGVTGYLLSGHDFCGRLLQTMGARLHQQSQETLSRYKYGGAVRFIRATMQQWKEHSSFPNNLKHLYTSALGADVRLSFGQGIGYCLEVLQRCICGRERPVDCEAQSAAWIHAN